MPRVTADHARTRLMIGTYHLTPVLGIELFRERSRAHQVTEHHRQLPTLSFRPSGIRGLRSGVSHLRCLWFFLFLLFAFYPFRLFALFRRTGPHQYRTIFIFGQPLGFDEFVLEVLQVVVIESESALQRPVRDPPFAL